MDSVFQELRRAREAKRLSINDVADATLINVGFLEAIERGNTTILPQTYVRAFIREYASFVGLDPVDIMKRYDQPKAESVGGIMEQKPPVAETVQMLEEVKKPEESLPSPPTSLTPIVARFALPAIIILVLGIILWNLTRTKTPPATKEIPLEHIAQDVAPDSVTKKNPVEQPHSAMADSLTLRATMTDSAWVQIVIDNREPQQYLFRPNRKITWRAKERFRITTGNAGALDLTLNEKHLGAPGKRGAVARNVEFNRQTLQQK